MRQPKQPHNHTPLATYLDNTTIRKKQIVRFDIAVNYILLVERTETSEDVTKHEATNDVIKATSGASIEHRAKRTERDKFHSNPKALSTNVGATPTHNPRHVLKRAQHLI